MKTSNAGNKRSRRTEKVPEKTSEELELEEFLFGKDIINDHQKNVDDEVEILIDTAPAQDSVWHDEEDEDIEVDLTQTNRLKKLRKSDSDPTTVTASELTNALQERFKTRQLDWAKVEDTATQAQVAERGFDNEDLELLHHSASMIGSTSTKTSTTTSTHRKNAKNKARSAATLYLEDSAVPSQPLPAGAINIKRLVNANIAEPSKQRITALDFHSNGDLLLVAGEDKNMRFFRIDGDKNEKQLSVKLQDMSIQSAAFRHTSTTSGSNSTSSSREEVILCGRKPFFYSYDIISGNIAKIPGPAGRGLNSLEYMKESPEGRLLAFRGASGYVHICNGATKQWALEIKQNSAVRSHCFIDEMTIATSGLDADVYVWDLRKTGRCVARFPHDDGTCTSFLSSYTPPRSTTSTAPTPYSSLYRLPRSYLAVGAESGVVSVFGADYDQYTSTYAFQSDTNTTTTGSTTNTSSTSIGNNQPKQLKSILNLTTPITSTCFHPTGQILAIASNQKQNQLKLIHLPSNTVFNNWPTQKTPFGRIECMSFSGKNTTTNTNYGGFFAIGNSTGKVLLYQLNHFGSV